MDARHTMPHLNTLGAIRTNKPSPFLPVLVRVRPLAHKHSEHHPITLIDDIFHQKVSRFSGNSHVDEHSTFFVDVQIVAITLKQRPPIQLPLFGGIALDVGGLKIPVRIVSPVTIAS